MEQVTASHCVFIITQQRGPSCTLYLMQPHMYRAVCSYAVKRTAALRRRQPASVASPAHSTTACQTAVAQATGVCRWDGSAWPAC